MIKKFRSLATFGKQSAPSGLIEQMKHVQHCEIAFHLAANFMPTPLHVEVWADHLNACGVAWYVIARDGHHLDRLRDMGVAVAHAASAAELRLAMGAKVRAVIYANNSHKNVEPLRCFPDLVHVQMLHGDSDKSSSFNPVTRNFDQIWVAGQLGQDRYAMNGVTVPDHAFVHVGRPQVRGRTVGPRAADWRDSPVIGYMPTWYGSQGDTKLSSYDRATQIIRTIRSVSSNAKILYKPHPLIHKDPNASVLEREVKAALRETGGIMVPKESEASHVYEQADVLVSDISSTMSDYLWSDRPMAVIAPRGFNEEMKAGFPSLGGSHLVDEELTNLSAALTDCLTSDSMAAARAGMRKYSFGGLEPHEAADAAFIRAVKALVAR